MMSKEKHEKDMAYCPVGRFFMDLEKVAGSKSKFFEHLNNSRIEFLRGIRALVDERIEKLEKKARKRGEKKADKIEVE
jgi:hypothetical protein